MALRWGIASAGKISHDFACALSTLPESDHKLVAVAARGLESAQKFADLHGIPKAHAGYEALAKDPNVDVVYIGSVNTTHLEIGLLMLENGKHVLCEKPLCLNEKQAKKLLETAKAKKLFCMEAVWSRFFPSYQYVKELITNGDLGEIKQIDVPFGVDLAMAENVQKKELGGSAILSIGIYNIQIVLWAFGEMPIEVTATGKLNDDGVDTEVNAVLKFKDGVANIQIDSLKFLENVCTIKGTKGTLKSGALGEIKQVDVNFGFNLTGVERLDSKDLGGGTILDLGVYTIQAALWAFREAPIEITAEGKLNNEGVDTGIKSVLKFKTGVANMQTSALEEFNNTAVIIGTKGTIKIPKFWCPPTIIDVNGQEKTWPLPKSKVPTKYFNSEGLRYEAEATRKCILEGKLEHEDVSHEESLRIVRIQDQLRKIIGMKFPQDE